jgi:hypothetical protein
MTSLFEAQPTKHIKNAKGGTSEDTEVCLSI